GTNPFLESAQSANKSDVRSTQTRIPESRTDRNSLLKFINRFSNHLIGAGTLQSRRNPILARISTPSWSFVHPETLRLSFQCFNP
ncbi:hypothetical protein NPIL_378951, partial [Nephila pilipes]